MAQYVEASQWFKDGDHSMVVQHGMTGHCYQCDAGMGHHGWIPSTKGGYIVCPGDWIIKDPKGEHYPCKLLTEAIDGN